MVERGCRGTGCLAHATFPGEHDDTALIGKGCVCHSITIEQQLCPDVQILQYAYGFPGLFFLICTVILLIWGTTRVVPQIGGQA